jgi:transposase-like protein
MEKKRERMVEVCPVCGSSEIYLETGGYVGKVYHCKDGNYMGALGVEADNEMVEAIKEGYGRRRRERVMRCSPNPVRSDSSSQAQKIENLKIL